MAEIVALADEETAAGFRLAGIEATGLASPEELARQAGLLKADPAVRIVIIDEGLFQLLPETLRKELEECRRPLFVPVPAVRPGAGALSPQERIARLMRGAIGYQIRIRR